MQLDVPLTSGLTGAVRLRALTSVDAEAFAAHVAGDLARLSTFLPWPARTAEPAGAAVMLGQYERGEDGRVLIAGVDVAGELVGGVVLFHHDPATASVELGCWAVAAAEGKGVVRAACLVALERARRELEVERVVWHSDPGNTRSRVLAERIGFRFEGTLRSSYVLRGQRCDTDVLSLVGAEIDEALA